ncbi:molecular chaperone [Endozoicomonas montiporae]|uniref:Pili assembly chaperone N-terminal domain-containing protein n=1 Tax=Endozoicomonas montiporae CL-33 TaxID=570277 RepID=A0A142BI87_9GAMM|nr:fimbria/pilus periplasmic chaperone [Endozoicomonas montiporae]AMO58463.1 hypothetical protein EZMO1_4551 [Endozoicomonas montiporae CL-33]
MEVRRKTGFLALALATFMTVPFASANMLLDRMIVYFEPGNQPRQDIRVTNVSEDNLFLQTEIYKVVNPGAENEERIRIINPDEMKLLATPQKSIVAPRGRRTVRLVNLETPKETEEVYRITFRPVTGDVEANQNAIQLLIAYQALIFVRPENPVYEVTAKREGNKVTFTNKGNSNVILRNGEQCTVTEKNGDCVEITAGGRIYAGQSLTLDLPGKGKLVRFGMFDGTREQRQEFSL